MRKRVAIVAPSSVPFAVGGAEKLWWGLQGAFRRYSDFDVELIKLPSPERNTWELIQSYQAFSTLDLRHFDLVLSTKYPAWMVTHRNHRVLLQHRLRGLYDTYSADQPLEPDWPAPLGELRSLLAEPAAIEARAALFSVLAELHQALPQARWDDWFRLPGPLSRKIIRWLDDSALAPQNVRKFMAISQTVVRREGYFPANVPVQVIHHPSDLVPAEPGAGEYFFTASRLDSPKRIELLVRAFMASDARQKLLVAGTGPLEDALRALAVKDPRVRFLGHVADADLRRYYGSALCVPFIPEDEDLGLVTIEAMQAGKPVLTVSDAGGVLEFVEAGKTGWVVAPEIDALADCISVIARTPDVAKAMSGDCQKRVAHINWQDTLKAILYTGFDLDPFGHREWGKPRHILVPLTFPIWPPRTGGQHRVYHLYRRIARSVPVTLLTLASSDVSALDGEIAPGLFERRVAKSPDHAAREEALTQALGGVSAGDLFAMAHVDATPAYCEALRQCCDQADLVVASHPYLYPAIQSVYRGPVYYEAHNAEIDLKRSLLSDATQAEVWLDRLEQVEGECARHAIGVSACSVEDARRLAELYGLEQASIAIVPNGVALGEVPSVPPALRLRANARIAGSQRAAVVFVGSWHGPNVDAVTWIINELAHACPELDFWVVGSVGDYWRNQPEFVCPRNVYLFGVLQAVDKNAVLSCALVAVNPVTTGSGSNLKMAEYAAADLPVVSTAFGCRGLNETEKSAVTVATLEQFPGALTGLVEALWKQPMEPRQNPLSASDWSHIADGFFRHIIDANRPETGEYDSLQVTTPALAACSG